MSIRHMWSMSALAVCALVVAAPEPSQAADCSAGRLTGSAALRSSWADDRPGLCRQITPADLPRPSASTTSHSTVIPRPAGALPKVPPGFTVTEFYRNTAVTRLIRTAPNGDLFVAESYAGRIRVLRPNAKGQLMTNRVFATGLNKPFGIAFYPKGANPQWVYVAQNDKVVRFPYRNGDYAPRGPAETIVPNLPQGAGQLPGKGHWTRDVVFSASGSIMFVSVGSYSNVQENGEDETRRATILAFKPTGGPAMVHGKGLRNPVAMAVSPVDGKLWTSVNERDRLGDNLVPDYITRVDNKQFFGWPWFYIGTNIDPRHATSYPKPIPAVTVPNVLLQAHSAALGIDFYTGTAFPAEYRGNLFVAVHGSWNRGNPIGSKVVRIPFDSTGKAKPHVEDFMTGFVTSNHNVWGRPVGIAMAKDGALYVSEDANNVIWRVAYTGGS
ncbi:MAG TPA: PQQ-dependent sugar dehydrogenase [Geminicoccus sp.]|jgi:glucose/arabinose dehydrogenase|uniref:PQQ-dependent sugar dehydrogenase n=1 Tax=Geminicoccus sp. TaxID=2024832 RepID=UPI002E34B9EB|nr:PQQ-dependent sugar dehydrogenase [Geminicoccus sp.]HEX2529586.1 PQQ-dependent sugar dehydrogenase [Geminicoccus sp.]